MRRLTCIFLWFFLCLSVCTNAQETLQVSDEVKDAVSIFRYINKAMLFNQKVPQEKVYLHFDNTSYFEGETMWFKAYVVRTDSCRLSDLSRVLYVELLNPTGDVIKKRKYKIDGDGIAHGDIPLDTIYGSGFYEVRAYTRYMTNWGTNACFSRVFPVYEPVTAEGNYANPVIRTASWRKRDPNSRDRSDSLYLNAIDQGIQDSDLRKTLSVSFYPEGGNMVVGQPCRVALLAVDDNGRPYQGKGWVTDSSEDVVAMVETDSLGRGLFTVVPDGRPMRMQVRNLKDKTQYFDLPSAQQEGCALSLDAESDNMLARLRCTEGVCGRLLAYVLVHGGNILRADTMKAAPLIEIEVGRKNMPGGVSQLTVFGSDGRIMAERLFFVCPEADKADSVTVTAKTEKLTPCGRVSLELKTRPDARLSFTAMDAATMKNGTYGNIRQWMLLGSDVRGYIHDVGYYFESDDQEHRRSADLLMLTQGWRRYDWEQMAYIKPLYNPQPVEEGLNLYGRLGAYRKHNPATLVDLEVYLYNQQGYSLSGHTRTDIYGNYAFSVPDIEGEWMTQIFTRLDGKRKTFLVGIDRQFSPVARYITPLEAARREIDRPNLFVRPLEWVDDDTVYVPLSKREHVLRNVTVKAWRPYFTNDDWQYKKESWGKEYATLYYNVDRELDAIRDRGEADPTTFEFLCKRNPLFNDPEAKFVPTAWALDIGWNGSISYDYRPISWIIDNGMTNIANATSDRSGFNADMFFPIDLSEIRSIYIQPDNPREYNSTVRIYMYLHKKYTTESNKGLRKTYFDGYNTPETFQMEDYSVIPPIEDFRRTIYWQPDVKTDSEGKAKIEFYNNSSCREMFISVEGMTPDGKFLTNQ